jgi:hypothetical protein
MGPPPPATPSYDLRKLGIKPGRPTDRVWIERRALEDLLATCNECGRRLDAAYKVLDELRRAH